MTFTDQTGKDCVRAWEAMPWALQGNLTPAQDQWLKNHLAHCPSCREEFAQQQQWQHALSLSADIPVDAEAGLERLLARIDAPEPQASGSRRPGSWLVRAAIAAMLVQTIGLGVMGAKLWSTQPTYRTLGQPTASTPPDALRVVPEASMTLAQWDALLHAMDLQVVAGPNAVGAYTVAPADADKTQRQALLQRLRSTHGIRLAEPVADLP